MNAWNEGGRGGGGDPHWANSNLGGMMCSLGVQIKGGGGKFSTINKRGGAYTDL